MTKLGNKCARCGATSDLTFDCIIPMGGEHHEFDTSQRMSFYNAMALVDNLQILCHSCNSAKGNQKTILTSLVTAKLDSL